LYYWWLDLGREQDTVMLRRQLTRKQLLPFLARLEPCRVGMEACGGAHYWAREIGKLDHTARLMSPHFVKPYRKSQKNDGNDAEAFSYNHIVLPACGRRTVDSASLDRRYCCICLPVRHGNRSHAMRLSAA
jgi:hypothetical protein